MSDKLRKALENAISVIESVRESGAVDADDLLWLDRECAAAANAGYIALAARHDSPTLDVQRLKAAIAKHQEGRPYSYSERCVPHCAPDIAREYAALAPADPTADLRADIEHRARMQDALDALMQATLWVHRTVDMPREPKSWDSKARSGIVGLRAALAAAPKVESVRAASERLGIPIGHVRDYPHRFAPFEDDGLVQRAHVACCWCGEHHEEGR